MIQYNEKDTYFTSSLIQPFVKFHGFGTKFVQDLRSLFNPRAILKMNQVHGVDVRMITSAHKDEIVGDIDGMITSERDVMLCVRTADCLPALYVDPHIGHIGASHQGWKGTYENMAQSMIDSFVHLGSEPKNIRVALGPAIGPCCYDIYGDRLDAFQTRYADLADDFLQRRDGQTFLNITRLNMLQLEKEGILRENIDYSLECTMCDTARMYSFKRGDIDQRLWSFIQL